MGLSGWGASNQELVAHGRAPLTLLSYLRGGDFSSTVFENWESEFLQMAAYVILTAFLYQRGSAESRDPDEPEEPRSAPPRSLLALLHAYSLGIALSLLFVASFALHLWGSQRAAIDKAILHGGNPPSLAEHIVSTQFWFESFQNWQSEFLATATLVVLSIVLRFRGSPESKHVEAKNSETGR